MEKTSDFNGKEQEETFRWMQWHPSAIMAGKSSINAGLKWLQSESRFGDFPANHVWLLEGTPFNAFLQAFSAFLFSSQSSRLHCWAPNHRLRFNRSHDSWNSWQMTLAAINLNDMPLKMHEHELPSGSLNPPFITVQLETWIILDPFIYGGFSILNHIKPYKTHI